MSRFWIYCAVVSFGFFSGCRTAPEARPPNPFSFAGFDALGRLGHPLTVVFIGGRTTANASEPSYRELLQDYWRATYPKTAFTFYTEPELADSKQAIFDWEERVHFRRPDLLVIDYTAADNPESTERELLASYERLLFDSIAADIPVLQILIGNPNNFGPDRRLSEPPRLRDHVELGRLYRTAVANCFPRIENFLYGEKHSPDEIWTANGRYINPMGQKIICETAQRAYRDAVQSGVVCRLPAQPLFAGMYAHRSRVYLAEWAIPAGWNLADPLTGDPVDAPAHSLIACDPADRDLVEPIHFAFSGTYVALAGEAEPGSPGLKIVLDGILLPSGPRSSGQFPDTLWSIKTESGEEKSLFWREIASRMPPGPHTLDIQPVFPIGGGGGKLRLQSICVGDE